MLPAGVRDALLFCLSLSLLLLLLIWVGDIFNDIIHAIVRQPKSTLGNNQNNKKFLILIFTDRFELN